jgi:hypothetical protein
MPSRSPVAEVGGTPYYSHPRTLPFQQTESISSPDLSYFGFTSISVNKPLYPLDNPEAKKMSTGFPVATQKVGRNYNSHSSEHTSPLRRDDVKGPSQHLNKSERRHTPDTDQPSQPKRSKRQVYHQNVYQTRSDKDQPFHKRNNFYGRRGTLKCQQCRGRRKKVLVFLLKYIDFDSAFTVPWINPANSVWTATLRPVSRSGDQKQPWLPPLHRNKSRRGSTDHWSPREFPLFEARVL